MIDDTQTGTSPYDAAEVIDYADGSGDYTLENPEEFYSMSVSTSTTHTVKEGETLQNIANKYYKDSGMWYIIAMANDIMNPFSDELYSGQQLTIPM